MISLERLLDGLEVTVDPLELDERFAREPLARDRNEGTARVGAQGSRNPANR